MSTDIGGGLLEGGGGGGLTRASTVRTNTG